jgi:hypothetical protein
MAHVTAVTVDLLVQMLPAVLADPKAMDLFLWVEQELLQFLTVGAVAAQLNILRPMRRDLHRRFRQVFQVVQTVLPNLAVTGFASRLVTLRLMDLPGYNGFC